MTTITFYNGLREIGGTFVVVETEQARCMFDFGFAVMDRMDEKIAIRKKDCAADYARLGVLARQDGLYDQTTAEKLGVVSFEDDKKKSFLIISHMHIDHMGGLGMLDPKLPVYMSEDSLKLYRRLEARGDIQVRGHENCVGVPYGGSFRVGDISVRVSAIDHDVIGACGYLITTPGGTICYTGDYRFHGFHPEVTRAFGQEMKGADVMITEGVTVSFVDVDMLSISKPEEPGRSELWLQEEMKRLSREEKGLIVVNPYNRNVERLHCLIHTLKENGRTLVMDDIQADYVHAFYPGDPIYVYEAIPERNEALEQEWGWKTVSRRELLQQPDRYVLQLDYQNLYELMDLNKVTSIYVHMDGSPLGDYDPSFNKLKKILEQLEIPYVHMGTGGHSRPYDLRTMIDTIAPRILVPLHSVRPEQVMSGAAGKRILPRYGECFELKDGEMTSLGILPGDFGQTQAAAGKSSED